MIKKSGEFVGKQGLVSNQSCQLERHGYRSKEGGIQSGEQIHFSNIGGMFGCCAL